MADLYKCFIKPKEKHEPFKGEFTKEYSELNTLFDDKKTNFEQILYNTQINILKNMEKEDDYQAVNDFLNWADGKDEMQEDATQMTISEAIGKIVDSLNKMLASHEDSILYTNIKQVGSDGKEHYKPRKAAERDIKYEEEKKALEEALAQLQLTGSIKKEIISVFNQGYLHKRKGGLYGRNYITQKANIVEQLAVEMITKYKGGSLGFVSGAFFDKDGLMLIEDALASMVDKNLKNKKGELITVEVQVGKGGRDNTTTRTFSTFQEFLDIVKEAEQSKEHIYLTDEAYEALQLASDIKAQAKSGIDQPILNKNERNAISLEKIHFNEESFKLWQLFTQQAKAGRYFLEEADQTKSKTMEMLANWCLSKNINLTNISKNNLYVSEHGLQSASQWLQSTKNYMLFTPEKISKISEGIYEKEYKYGFKHI